MKRFLGAEAGVVLITTYFLLVALMALLGVYYTLSRVEIATTRHSKESATGFYSAEAGLNLRAEEIRNIFVGYNRPSGTAPNETLPVCQSSNLGADDFSCQLLRINNRSVHTYVTEDPANPVILTIPPGEQFQNLNAQEYRYTVKSEAKNIRGETESILELRFKSRLVPLFQFVAFYNKDLEILPGPTMNLSGPIHTNGDLYLNANNSLNIAGQVTSAGDLYRGRKDTSVCNSTQVTVLDPSNPLAILPACPTRTLVPSSNLSPWNGMLQSQVDILTVPEPDALNASPGQIYWDKADLRLRLRLNNSNNPITSVESPTGIYVFNTDLTIHNAQTAAINNCSGSITGRSIGYSNSFYNNREGHPIHMLELDMQSLFDCLLSTSWLGEGKGLDDNSEGGLVLHLSIEGPDSADSQSNYAARIRNASRLQSSDAAAPLIRGLTVVSDQAIYVRGDYNSLNKIPAALLADTFNILSNNWNLNDSTSTLTLSNRTASNTVINAAILAGTDTTGGVEGAGGQDGAYNGGLENYPRFHENWSGRTLTYRGSFVSLNEPLHASGSWIYGSPQYTAPNRNWDYDTDFNDAANLPPLTPRFVYLRQELFSREFER